MAKTAAIVGASSDRKKFSNKSVRAHLRQGWTVYPVNPKGGEIEELPVYAALRQVPRPIHRITIYVPPAVGLEMVEEIAAADAEEVFLNPGAESEELVAALRSHGVNPLLACSIVDIGESPAAFSEA